VWHFFYDESFQSVGTSRGPEWAEASYSCSRRGSIWWMDSPLPFKERRKSHVVGCLGARKFSGEFRRRNSRDSGNLWSEPTLHKDGSARSAALA